METLDRLPDIFAYLGDAPATPRYSPDLVRLENARSPLTSIQVNMCWQNQIITYMGFMEIEPDLELLGRCIDALMRRYPFFQSKIVFDPELSWLRFEPSTLPPTRLAYPEETVRRLNDLSDVFVKSHKTISGNRLIWWEVLRLDCPEAPMFKSVIALHVPHALAEGSSLSRLFKLINEFYTNGIPEHIEPVQQAPYTYLMSTSGLSPESLGSARAAGPIVPTKLEPEIKDAYTVGESIYVAFHFFPTQLLTKLPGQPFSVSLYAVNFAVMAAYNLLHGGSDFVFTGKDMRRIYERLQAMCPGLDLETRDIGQGVTQNMLLVRGDAMTTISDLAAQTAACINRGLQIPAEARMVNMRLIETCSLKPEYPYASCSMVASNVGLLDLGAEYPVSQATGFAVRGASSADQSVEIGTGSIISGRHGTFYLETRQKGLAPERQEANFRAILAVHAALKTRDADSITVAEVAEMLQKEYDVQK